MRLCAKCRQLKSDDSFHRRGPQGRQPVCKDCKRDMDRVRYLADIPRHVAIRTKRKTELRRWLQGFKSGQPCVDCGGSFHFAAMQFDHTGTNKVINVADTIGIGWSRERILQEIAKCDLVCANCHAVRTYERREAEQRCVAQ